MRDTGAVGNTYVLVANPGRPNGGILERFNGVSVPILDITFNGATPTDGDITYDIARQYDGWADFPKYPLNLLATANAVLGIVYLHGKYDQDIDPADLDNPAKTDKTVYNNTTYYLIHTDRLPLLMPFDGILPDTFLDALDAPLRELVELGYDRTNYGNPYPGRVVPPGQSRPTCQGSRRRASHQHRTGAKYLVGYRPGRDASRIHPALTGPAPTGSHSAVASHRTEATQGAGNARRSERCCDQVSPSRPPRRNHRMTNNPPPSLREHARTRRTPTEPVGRSTRKPHTSAPGRATVVCRWRRPMAPDAGDAGVQRKSGHRSVDAGTRTDPGTDKADPTTTAQIAPRPTGLPPTRSPEPGGS